VQWVEVHSVYSHCPQGVGDVVGDAVGYAVGYAVGEAVGDAVGYVVGTLVCGSSHGLHGVH
jgi:hypothetical protein